ncbi:MAG TPA: histidine kinase dimerization/phospho-acceptor domain-containing protein, partial [Solirubrobacteraceae bacterium]|nr:histidine kinase dimerization/phospho-acceptor domain-containing protein [Solirubrobacteraceae bacterium]
MMRRRRPRLGLRGRLAAAIAAVLLVTVGATFVVIYRGTGSEVRAEIERELRGAIADFSSRGLPAVASSPQATATAARRYLATQPFHASSRLLFASVSGAGIVTNEPELLGLVRTPDEPTAVERTVELREAQALRAAPIGFSTVDVRDVGALRLLTRQVKLGSRVVATVGVGESLDPVARAQRGVARTFALAGTVTLLVALLLAYLIAARISGPLRRMARIATRVDGGDLSPRIAADGPRDEVRVLAEAFDHMLDRLEAAFAHQRAFLADTSHELRTPLTIIRGQLEVLARQDRVETEDVRRVERLVRAEVERMERLVDDLMVLAHADEPAFLYPRQVDLVPYVAELVDAFRALGDRRIECGGIPDGYLT